jgi:hypothetical protein
LRFPASSELIGLAPAKSKAFEQIDFDHLANRQALSRRQGGGVMNEEEYDRWLAESLNEALALLRRKVAKAAPHHVLAAGQPPGVDVQYPDMNWLEAQDDDTRPACHTEALSLKMIGLFTLLATHAELNVDHAPTTLCERRGPRDFEAINHLALAIEEVKLGHVEAAKIHAREALRRLNVNKPLP